MGAHTDGTDDEQALAVPNGGVRRAHAIVKRHARMAYAPPALRRLDPASEPGPAIPLAEARKAAALSMPALARRSGVSLSTIYRIEYGKTRPRAHVVHALSSALGRAPGEIAEFRDLRPDPSPRVS